GSRPMGDLAWHPNSVRGSVLGIPGLQNRMFDGQDRPGEYPVAIRVPNALRSSDSIAKSTSKTRHKCMTERHSHPLNSRALLSLLGVLILVQRSSNLHVSHISIRDRSS